MVHRKCVGKFQATKVVVGAVVPFTYDYRRFELQWLRVIV